MHRLGESQPRDSSHNRVVSRSHKRMAARPRPDIANGLRTFSAPASWRSERRHYLADDRLRFTFATLFRNSERSVWLAFDLPAFLLSRPGTSVSL